MVPSLAVQYVPNQGFRYYAVVPVHSSVNPSKSAYLKTNDALLGKEHERFDKPNGRYNAKLKKYKAFEKVKYVPYYMVSTFYYPFICYDTNDLTKQVCHHIHWEPFEYANLGH